MKSIKTVMAKHPNATARLVAGMLWQVGYPDRHDPNVRVPLGKAMGTPGLAWSSAAARLRANSGKAGD